MLMFLILRRCTAMLAYIVIGFIFPANCAVCLRWMRTFRRFPVLALTFARVYVMPARCPRMA
jgi:hypothetical protein